MDSIESKNNGIEKGKKFEKKKIKNKIYEYSIIPL